jgi:protein TonB
MRSVSRKSFAGRVEDLRLTDRGADGDDALGRADALDESTSAARSHTVAWVLSLILHGLVFGTVLYVLQPIARPQPPNPERLVYVEPAPPPPPPLAVDGGGGAPEEKPQPEEQSQPEERVPQLVELENPKKPIPSVRRSPKPTVRAVRRQPAAEPPPAAVEAARGGESGGEAQGVIGGVVGGKIGGTVGGHGDAPIAAELAASAPVVVSRVLPEYPAAARAQHVEGQVLLRAVVDRAGHVEEHIVVVRSVAPLDDAAVAALRQWTFTPGRDHDGHTARVQIEVPMRFQLR